jgi:hypothetical protein
MKRPLLFASASFDCVLGRLVHLCGSVSTRTVTARWSGTEISLEPHIGNQGRMIRDRGLGAGKFVRAKAGHIPGRAEITLRCTQDVVDF